MNRIFIYFRITIRAKAPSFWEGWDGFLTTFKDESLRHKQQQQLP